MAFRVGQKVVCVDDTPRNYPKAWVVKGTVYTIRGFTESPLGGTGVLLEEISPNLPPYSNGLERGYYPSRFRPAVERKTNTGMAVLRKLLVGGKVDEKV